MSYLLIHQRLPLLPLLSRSHTYKRLGLSKVHLASFSQLPMTRLILMRPLRMRNMRIEAVPLMWPETGSQ